MGCWDIFCIVCGLPSYFVNLIDLEDSKLDLSSINKKTQWLKKNLFLTSTNDVIENCEETNCNINFECKNKKNYTQEIEVKNFIKFFDFYDNFGLFIHNDCYLYIKKYYNISLKLGDFKLENISLKLGDSKLDNKIKNEVTKYWGQEFDIISMINDNNLWMAESPLKNDKNAKRIDKIIKQLKIKPGKKEPNISPSFYKNGTIKIGNDGYFWEVKNNKWLKLNKDPVEKVIDFNQKILLKIPTIAFTNTKPIFIKNFNNKKITIIQ